MADSISIISSPPKIALIDEGLKFTLERNSGGITGKADLTILFPNDQTKYLDKYFEIVLPDRTLKFYFKTSPDESGLQLGTWTVGLSLVQFLAIVMDDIQKNYYLNKDYTVDIVSGTSLEITARNVGTAYNLELGNTDVDGMSEDSKTAGIDDPTPADYRVYVAVCLKADGIDMAVPLGDDLLPVDDQDKVYANIGEYLKDQLRTGFNFPYNGTILFEHPNGSVYYYIRYGEFENETFQKLYNNYTAYLYALPGGLKQIDSDRILDLDTDYFTMFAHRFLTWAPLVKTIYPNVSERLYFFTQATGLSVKVRRHYNGLSVENELLSITAAAFTVIELACGPSELFDTDELEDLLSYDIWITDADDLAVSEVRSFEMDNQPYLNIRTLIFQNSFNFYDFLHCTGDLTISDKVKREEYESLSNDAFRRQISLAENTASFDLNTGWLLDKETRLWLEDLQLSKDSFLVLGDFLMPVVMKTAKVTRIKDREHLHSLKITFEPDYRDERFSSIIGDGSQDLYLDGLTNMLVSSFRTRVETAGGEIINEPCLKTRVRSLLDINLS